MSGCCCSGEDKTFHFSVEHDFVQSNSAALSQCVGPLDNQQGTLSLFLPAFPSAQQLELHAQTIP